MLTSVSKPDAKPQAKPTVPSKTEAQAAARTHSIRTEVPDYLAKQLRLRAAERDCTIRFLLLEALKANGFAVHDADLLEDGRRNTVA